MFASIALLGFLLLLLVIESAARLAGLGHPARFFLKEEGELTLNHEYFRIYFPRAMYRSPQPVRLARNLPAGVRRILFFGESAAMGDPEPAWGPVRLLEYLLESRHPGQDYEVHNLSVTAVNSHVIRPMAREASGIEADFWCLYMGNNEVHSQFGPGTVFGSRLSGRTWIRASIAIRKTRIGQGIDALIEPASGDAEWGGLAMFTEARVAADDPRMEHVYRHFESNLKAIVESGLESGAIVLAGTMAVNLRESSPFASAPPDHLSEDERKRWETLHRKARRLHEEGSHDDAMETIREALDLHPGHAGLRFLAGETLWDMGETDKALAQYVEARDLDTLRFRTDSRLNRILRDTLPDYPAERTGLVDIEGTFLLNAPGSIPGNEFFWDHVHFRFPGSYLVALAYAREIESRLTGLPDELPPWPTLEDCARDLALTHWSDHRMTQTMRERMSREPFRSQTVHASRDQRLARELEEHAAGLSPGSFLPQKAAFEARLGVHPDDYLLRCQFAQFLKDFGRRDEAIAQWKHAIDDMPRFLNAHFQVGLALAEDPQRLDEAETHLRQALRIRPHTADIHIALGKVLMDLDRYGEALDQLEAALDLRPTSGDLLDLCAEACMALGHRGKAKEYRERARP